MKQSTLAQTSPISGLPQVASHDDAFVDPVAGNGSERLHVGIIMDGNGRWAVQRGLPRAAGHRAGAAAVRRTVAAAPTHGIGVLTLYAFSADNWKRPVPEVRNLMRLLYTHLRSEVDRCVEEGVRVSVIGRRDRLSPGLVAEIESAEARSREGRTLHLQLAIDYSSRDAIVSAASRARTPEEVNDRERFRQLISRAVHAEASIPDADLIIRTGGETRLSDFLLWESAYAELSFLPCLWPDFGEADLASAMAWFSRRQRRYGGLSEAGQLTRGLINESGCTHDLIGTAS